MIRNADPSQVSAPANWVDCDGAKVFGRACPPCEPANATFEIAAGVLFGIGILSNGIVLFLVLREKCKRGGKKALKVISPEDSDKAFSKRKTKGRTSFAAGEDKYKVKPQKKSQAQIDAENDALVNEAMVDMDDDY